MTRVHVYVPVLLGRAQLLNRDGRLQFWTLHVFLVCLCMSCLSVAVRFCEFGEFLEEFSQ